MENWTRRQFLRNAATAAGALVGKNVLALDLIAPVEDPIGLYPYRGWETFYRDQYTWDYVGRSTHSVNCTGSCSWKGYVKNGILFKEEQFKDYPLISTDLPTLNPRGCQKGANYKEYIYGPQRVKYPLIRVGARGQGLWRRASWNEALGLIANSIVKTIKSSGADAVTFFAAIPAKHHLTLAGGFRLCNLIGGTLCSFYDWYSDLPPGEPQTWGVQTDSCESADWFNSNYIILWGSNIVETRVPDGHFVHEAKMRGAKVVAIFPEYNGSTVHADLFLPIKPGTDSALAMAMAHVIVRDALYDAQYVRQYTDLPLLVRTDTRKFLRESDIKAGGRSDNLYFWDQTTGKAVQAPGTLGTVGTAQWTLDLGAANPALEGSFVVDTLNGKVQVRPVFEFLKDRLGLGASPVPNFMSDMAAQCGLNAELIRKVATDFATTKPARIIEGAGVNHWYHNDLNNRTEILLLALTGNVGKPGSGFDHYVGQEKLWAEHGFFDLSFPLGRPKQRFQNMTLWSYVHANIKSDTDDLLPRDLGYYIVDSVTNWQKDPAAGWQPLWPKGKITYDPATKVVRNSRDPKVLIVWGANYLNQAKGNHDILNTLWPKLDLIVDVNFRMDTTALYADVVLPASSFFEKWDLSTTDLHSYVHPFTPVIPPLFDSKTDWQIWQALARALQATGYTFTDTAPDGTLVTRDFKKIVTDFQNAKHSDTGAVMNVADDRAACQFLLDGSVETNGLTIMKDLPPPGVLTDDPTSIVQHPRRFKQTSDEWTSDLIEGKAYYGFQRMTEKKRPLTTFNGRQQFYIDHDWYLGLNEELPMYKSPVASDQYPLRWITPHGRWSIHSTWRDAKFQLRLQRGRPIVYLSPGEAASRGLVDNDLVEVFNGHGAVQAHLNVAARMADGMAMMYHGWERYFLNAGWQSPTTIRINPTQLAGGYGQLKFRLNYWGPTGAQKDTRVDVRKV